VGSVQGGARRFDALTEPKLASAVDRWGAARLACGPAPRSLGGLLRAHIRRMTRQRTQSIDTLQQGAPAPMARADVRPRAVPGALKSKTTLTGMGNPPGVLPPPLPPPRRPVAVRALPPPRAPSPALILDSPANLKRRAWPALGYAFGPIEPRERTTPPWVMPPRDVLVAPSAEASAPWMSAAMLLPAPAVVRMRSAKAHQRTSPLVPGPSPAETMTSPLAAPAIGAPAAEAEAQTAPEGEPLRPAQAAQTTAPTTPPKAPSRSKARGVGTSSAAPAKTHPLKSTTNDGF